jgi:hypothetical protein
VVTEVVVLEVAALKIVVFESAMLKAPRALKVEEGVTEADWAAMIEICG